MRKSVRAASTRCAVYLEEEKKKNKSFSTENAKKIIDREINEVRNKNTEKNESCKMLDEKFVSLGEEADKKRDMNLAVLANS